MTEGTKPDTAPEAVRLDVDPGRNVDQARLSAAPLSNAEKRAEARENAQAADRREASPASYKGPERTRDRPWPAIVLAVVVVLVILAAFMLYWR